jgi:hypothetical protein
MFHLAAWQAREALDHRETNSETELSVASPKPRVANVRSTRFSRPTTMTAGPRPSILFPSSVTEQETRRKIARFGGKEPGPMVDRALSASH